MNDHQNINFQVWKIGAKERSGTSSPELEFQCPECSFSASKKRTLKTHVLAKHRGVVRYNCSQCEFKNYRKDLVEIHIETFHSGEEAQVLYLNSPEFTAWNYGDNSIVGEKVNQLVAT